MDKRTRALGVALFLLGGCAPSQPRPAFAPEDPPIAGAAPSEKPAEHPIPWKARGRVVCLAELMQQRHKADIPPVHEHLWGFAVEGELGAAEPRCLVILRSSQSEALFVDPRFRERVLVLSGRRFPQSALVELSGWLWERDGKLWRPYYWCGVCSIRGVNPGDCACCQAPVELREEAARED
jgi:hypothetical protein